MKVGIKTLDGKMFEVELEPGMLVGEAKEIVASASPGQGFAPERQKLICAGKVMDNSKTLAEYSVVDKSFIVCMLSKVPAPSAATTSQQHAHAAAQPPVQPSHSHDGGVHGEEDEEDEEDDDEDFEDGDEVDPEAMMAQLMQQDDATVLNLAGITGQPEHAVRLALHMAQGSADVAADYLMNGMPEIDNDDEDDAYGDEDGDAQGGFSEYGTTFEGLAGLDIASAVAVAAAQQQAHQQAAAAAAPAPAPTAGVAGPLEQLRGHPDFDSLRQMVQTNPSMLQSAIQQITAQSPEMLAAIQANPSAFLALLNEPFAGSPTTASPSTTPAAAPSVNVAFPGGAAGNELSPEEMAAVARLAEMGFAQDRALEAFLACDRNEEAAANFLFDSS